MNDAHRHVAEALPDMRNALTRLEEALGCVKAQQLKDFDARALALARTELETAVMWAEKARYR